MLENTRVLISGASIAGPALALWLQRYGFKVTLVEKAASIRRGGQAVDFKGHAHMTVLERMGILDEVRQLRFTSPGDSVVVDATGRKVATIPAAFSGGELEIRRGDLADLLYRRTVGTCEYIFGDSITSLEETNGGITVTFEHSAPRAFDLVVGADGIHSNVRKLAFGPESEFVHHLGYYYAFAEIKGETGREDLMYNEPSRMAATSGPKAPAFFVFASEPLQYGRDDAEQQKALLQQKYEGASWKVSELMNEVPNAEGFYMDAISRVIIDRYASGRVVLVGDSAYGNALGGFGTGLAMVGAYVLAGELLRASGDRQVAFAQYENKFRHYAKVSQKVNAGTVLAPRTRLGLLLRNRLFSIAFLFAGVMKLVDRFATDIQLENYPTAAA